MSSIIFLLSIFLGVSGQNMVTTLLGNITDQGYVDGVGTNALFFYPNGLALDEAAGLVYIADSDNNNLRVADLTSLTVTTLLGNGQGSSDGMGTACKFWNPNTVAIDTTRGILYVTDMYNNLIRSVAIGPRVCETLGGGGGDNSPGSSDGVGTNALFNNPGALALDTGVGVLYITDTLNSKIRVLSLDTLAITTLVGGGSSGKTAGYADGYGTTALFGLAPYGVALCAPGLLCVADWTNNLLRTVTLATAQVDTLAGQTMAGSADGVGTSATFTQPFVITPWHNTDILVTSANSVRMVNLFTRSVTTLAGSAIEGHSDGLGTAASFHTPQGIVVYMGGAAGPQLLIVDAGNFAVRTMPFNVSSV